MKARGLTLVPYPDPFRPFEGDPSGDALLAHIERLLANSCPGDDVACFFIEPIQADGGLIVPPPNFLNRLSQLCAHYGILTVCDEVKVGLGRAGMMHCFEYEDFVPDILVLGKGLGGGLPVSAIIGPSRIMDFATAFSMQTLHGNPVCASAALAVLKTIQAENLASKAQETGRILMSEITHETSNLPEVGDVRGRGLAIGVELIKADGRDPDADLARKVVYRAWQIGAVFYYVGMNSSVLELTPPLILSEDEARILFRAMFLILHD